MSDLIIIAAIGKDREIGYKNNLIWRLKEDLDFFRTTITNKLIVMGRKTYDSIPKNLPAKKYIVISKTLSPSKDIAVFRSISDFLQFAQTTDEDIYIIGGGEIYSALLPHTKKLILTEINNILPEADTHFPSFQKSEYKIRNIGKFNENGTGYTRNIYEKIKNAASPHFCSPNYLAIIPGS